MQLAERIRRIRENLGLTQIEVAERIDISASAYGQIERKAGSSTYYTLCKIAEALGVSLNFMLDINSVEFIEQKNKP